MCAVSQQLNAEIAAVHSFPVLDEALEWAEDQVIFRYGGYIALKDSTHLKEQALLSGLTDDEIAGLAGRGAVRRYAAGQRIIAAEEPASSLFFLQSGMVSVKLPSGVR